MDIHFETSNKFIPLLRENTDDVTKCSSTSIASPNSKKPHPIISISRFEKKKEDQISVSPRIILKISRQLQYLTMTAMPVY